MVVCIGTKQFNDKTTHRQQAKHSVKIGFVCERENRIPGLFQDLFIFQGPYFFQILYNTTFKGALFSQERRNVKADSISLILTPVIKTGTNAQIE